MIENVKMPKINLLGVRKLLSVVVISLGIFSVGYLVGIKGYKAQIGGRDPYNVTISKELPPEFKDLDFSLFWRVWDSLSLFTALLRVWYRQ